MALRVVFGGTRRRWTGLLIAMCAGVAALGLASASTAHVTSTPKLGRVWAPGVAGYGAVRPRTINDNGDATSRVTHITWSHWGQARATGHGKAFWIWPGESSANGAIMAAATVVAWDLGRCKGTPAYLKVTWYFPGRGDTFDRRDFRNTCTGALSQYSPPARQCGSATLNSPPGTAHNIVAYGLSCTRARQIVSASPAMAHLNASRFRSGRFYCAANAPEVAGQPPATFWCGRGEATMSFTVARQPICGPPLAAVAIVCPVATRLRVWNAAA